jgi:hypothetical protein
VAGKLAGGGIDFDSMEIAGLYLLQDNDYRPYGF